MMSRCYKPRDKHYQDYGGRGVRACNRWHDVENFIADQEVGYKPGLLLDRRNNDGPYDPDNCKWSTPREQANNKRNNRRIAFGGRTLTLMQWSRETGLHYRTINSRLDLLGWSVADALTKPTRQGANAR